MALTAIDFKTLFPEFKDVSDTVVDTWITNAGCFVDANYWGDKADFATGLYAAHLLIYVGGQSGGANAGNSGIGPLRREKVGDLERDYDVGSSSDETGALLTTNYGRQFLELRKTLVITPRVIGCLNP